MFCDLVGSTALSQTLDPETLRDIVRAYQDVVGKDIEAWGGYVAQYLGDGVLAYFGYPIAHGDDARRAVQAGLDIQKHLVTLQTEIAVQARIGIHSGNAVIGDVGFGHKTERLALGDTPNVAARVQSVADPGQLVVSASTWRLVARYFVCTELGEYS